MFENKVQKIISAVSVGQKRQPIYYYYYYLCWLTLKGSVSHEII